MITATHVSDCGKYLYRVGNSSGRRGYNFTGLRTNVEFWDRYLVRWSPSIMSVKDLNPLADDPI